MTSVTPTEFTRLMTEIGGSTSAAESHGVLCGALCVHDSYPVESWLGEVAEEPPADVPHEFAVVHRETERALRGDQMQFQPLLAEEDASIAARARALGEWCEGFVYGVGTGSLGNLRRLPPDVGEILEDLAEISRAVAGDEDTDEENEVAYAELVEFVRVSVQLIHEELAETRESPRGSQ